MPREEFQTQQSGEYSVDDVWTKATDKQGHSAYLRVPIPKHWAGEVSAIIESNRFGYRNQQDFVRDAVYHRLHWAAQIIRDDRFLATLGHDRLTARVDFYMYESQQHAEFMDRLDEAQRVAQVTVDHQEFAKILDLLRDEAESLLREPYRSKALDRLNEMWDDVMLAQRQAERRAGDVVIPFQA